MSQPESIHAAETLHRVLEEAFGDRYRLSERLGSGSYGVVYRATDTMLDREVAIKQIRLDAFQIPEQADEMKRRAQREAKMAAKLRHPGIVAVHDIAHTESSTLIIMEFVTGTTLEARLKSKRRLALEETIDIVAQTADALDHAHANGVVHRDIKPANLMIDLDGNIKIADFGIAKSQSGSEMTSNITATGNVLGTPYYMSPEQARGEDELDGRSDLFSLACVTYECLAGVKPFRGKSVVDVLLQIVHKEAAGLDLEAHEIHPDIEPLFTKALAKKADARYQTARELVDALRTVPFVEPGEDAPRPVVTSRDPSSTSSFDVDLHGTLRDRSITDIICSIRDDAKTGILHLQQDTLSKRLYFLDGSIVFANSDIESERFGRFLVDSGVIDDEVYERALERMRKTGRRFGETLVALGTIDGTEIDSLVTGQIRNIIDSVFEWESGQFGFETIENPVEDDIALELPMADVLLHGVRSVVTESVIRQSIGNVDRIPHLVAPSPVDTSGMTLTSAEGFVLSCVDAATSISELAAISPLGEDDTLRCVYGLIAAGVLVLKDPEGKATTRTRRVRAPDPADAPSAAPRRAGESVEPTDPFLTEVEEKLTAFQGATYYEVLDVSRGATPQALKKSYYAQAKKFHPDRHRTTECAELQSRLESLLSKLTEAYDVLSDPPQRLRYDEKLPRLDAVDADATPEEAAEPAPTPQISPDVIAEAKYRAGMGYFKDRAYHEAVQNLKEAVRLAPSKLEYHKLLGRALTKNPKWRKQAEKHFQRVLDAEPYDTDCYLELATIYEEGGLPTRARKMYEQVIALEPDNERAVRKLSESGKTAFLNRFLGKHSGKGH